MLRLGYFLVTALSTATVAIGLYAIVDSYVSNIPEQVVVLAQAEDAAPAWLDPETTGSVTPKAERASADTDASLPAEDGGRTTWVDPPRRAKVVDRSAAVNDNTMELRLPRL